MFHSLPQFKYYKPQTLDEALRLLNELDDAKVMAGGTDLLIDMRIGRLRPKNIIDINDLNELRHIVDEGKYIHIGALTRLQELIDSEIVREKLPILYEAIYHMASWQIRNRGTIGGNLCNASPAADTAPPLMVLEAKLRAISIKGERTIDIRDFFIGPRKTLLNKNELLKEIIVPVYKGYGYSYMKLGRRNSFTLSIVSVASLVKIEDNVFSDVRIALNSIAPTPIRAFSVEKYLVGRKVTIDNVKAASKLVVKDISPITDIRATAEYRRDMAIILTFDALGIALKRLGIDFVKR
ncbi:MAG: xanthine dehydrogenase family protein subunit M [Thermoprotei archaeon]|nr:MAG: xanthine dehydrogenase family protein subunit M [Thermoprotei archaeon]